MVTVQKSAPPSDPVLEQATEVLIREARRRQRRRRLGILGIVLLLAASAVFTARVAGSNRAVPPIPPARPPVNVPEHPSTPARPAGPTLAAGEFGGFWHVHTTSLTIGADGNGTANWPGPITVPGESEATAPPSHAYLRLASVNGTRATGLISGSTDTTELPDGPVQLEVTNQDLLVVTPSHPITQFPLRWTGLCGSSASSLTVAQQVAAGINCGA